MENKKYILDGFEFDTKEDYDLAVNEQKGIQFLFKKYNMKDPKVALGVYNNAVEKKLFKTQYGVSFLYEMRKKIKSINGIEDEQLKTILIKNNEKNINEEKQRLVDKIKISIGINCILFIAIIAMIIIAATSGSTNIINYEAKIQDKYSAWETELKEREANVKEKEKSLGIDYNSQN